MPHLHVSGDLGHANEQVWEVMSHLEILRLQLEVSTTSEQLQISA